MHLNPEPYKPSAKYNFRPVLLAIAIVSAAHITAVAAESVVAIVSSETGPYQDALAGLKQELGESVPTFFLSRGEPQIPNSVRVVVAFGAKAALRNYPDQAVLVYALAPGTIIESQTAVKICMEPDHAILMKTMKKLDPGIKRLGILWISPRFQTYANELQAASRALNITIESSSLETSADVPDHLRKLYGRIDAFWLLPDPLLINAVSLPIIMEFSRSNKVPVFVPTAGLVEQGATASIGPSFREMGRQAGSAVRKILDDAPRESKIYSTNVGIVINKTVVAQLGLQIPEEVLRKDGVVP